MSYSKMVVRRSKIQELHDFFVYRDCLRKISSFDTIVQIVESVWRFYDVFTNFSLL